MCLRRLSKRVRLVVHLRRASPFGDIRILLDALIVENLRLKLILVLIFLDEARRADEGDGNIQLFKNLDLLSADDKSIDDLLELLLLLIQFRLELVVHKPDRILQFLQVIQQPG